MNLSVIILHYNTPELVKKCIDSIIETQKVKHEIIVLDNNSSKENLEKLDSLLRNQQIKVIKNSENVGFAKGCNIASKQSGGDYMLFLNSDTELKKGQLNEMMEYLESNKNIGVLGGKMTNSDGSIQKSAGRFYNALNLIVLLIGGERMGLLRSSFSSASQVDWVSGGFMMVKRDKFQEISGFDENFFMYIEDMELCYRFKKNGLSTYFFPSVIVSHHSQGSSNRSFAVIEIYKGIIYFFKKHKSFLELMFAIFLLKLKAFLIYVFGLLTNNRYYIDTYKKALRI